MIFSKYFGGIGLLVMNDLLWLILNAIKTKKPEVSTWDYDLLKNSVHEKFLSAKLVFLFSLTTKIEFSYLLFSINSGWCCCFVLEVRILSQVLYMWVEERCTPLSSRTFLFCKYCLRSAFLMNQGNCPTPCCKYCTGCWYTICICSKKKWNFYRCYKKWQLSFISI